MRNFITSIITVCILCGIALSPSCGSAGDETETTTTSAGDTTTAAEDSYEHPDVDYEGAEFRILNLEALWDMFIHIDRAEINGEVLKDAVYNRNGKLEQQMNFVVNEITQPEDMAHADALRAAVPGVELDFEEGDFLLGGLIVECPELSRLADLSFDSALDDLEGRFSEVTGFNMEG